MKNKVGKRLVIDASIARASGAPTSKDNVAQNCRKVLEVIRESGHLMVITPEILSEWKRHQSNFAMSWRKSMNARKLVVDPGIEQDKAFRRKLTENVTWSDEYEMEKDCCLLEASLATDRIVLSRDDAAKQNFCSACQHVRKIQDICWENPATDISVMTWLEDGADRNRRKKLSEHC